MNGVMYNEAWGMSPLQRSNILDFIVDIRKRENEAVSGKTHM